MFFSLTQQAIDILIIKYNVKKSFIRKIEGKVNVLNIVKNGNEYIDLIDQIIGTFTYLKIQIKEFNNNNKDKIILTMTLDDIITFQIKRKYGENTFEKRIIKKIKRRNYVY